MTTLAPAAVAPRPASPWLRWAMAALSVALLVLLYSQLQRIATFTTYGVAGLTRGSHLASAVEFFIFEVPKVLLLLTGVVFVVGVLRSFFTPERGRQLLAGKREASGNVLALDHYARPATGVILIAVGIYESLRSIFLVL
jgi:uncharacterized protein